MLYRNKYYNPQANLQQNLDLTDLIIAKQRNGPTGSIKLKFDEKRTKFLDMDLEV